MNCLHYMAWTTEQKYLCTPRELSAHPGKSVATTHSRLSLHPGEDREWVVKFILGAGSCLRRSTNSLGYFRMVQHGKVGERSLIWSSENRFTNGTERMIDMTWKMKLLNVVMGTAEIWTQNNTLLVRNHPCVEGRLCHMRDKKTRSQRIINTALKLIV